MPRWRCMKVCPVMKIFCLAQGPANTMYARTQTQTFVMLYLHSISCDFPLLLFSPSLPLLLRLSPSPSPSPTLSRSPRLVCMDICTCVYVWVRVCVGICICVCVHVCAWVCGIVSHFTFLVSEETISKTLNQLQKSINKVSEELRHHEIAKEKEDFFYKHMFEFVNKANSMLKSYTVQFAKLQDLIKSLAGYYCLDLKKAPIEEIFSDISTFLDNFKV